MAINLNGFKNTNSLKTLENGIYTGVVTRANYGLSREGNERINLTVEVDQEGVAAFTSVAWHTLSTQRYFAGLLNATELMPEDGIVDDSEGGLEALAASMVGKRMAVHVAPELYNGRVSHQVKDHWHLDMLGEARRQFRQQQALLQGSGHKAPRTTQKSGTTYKEMSAAAQNNPTDELR